MMYIVLHVTQTADGVVAKEVYDYTCLEAAKEKAYSLLAYDYNAAVYPTLNYFLVQIIDETGAVVMLEKWERPYRDYAC